ncbi:hypothetical protein A2U01_0070998 [Trifolium medium]|uniref:Uncharacterized protein n=1 Tax=Trifolium medium TaxID=97028 RepID=A0A392SNI7_9FABA|nr:hypothetical protein [Trifolium medium]
MAVCGGFAAVKSLSFFLPLCDGGCEIGVVIECDDGG